MDSVSPLYPPKLTPTLTPDIRPTARRIHPHSFLSQLAEPRFRESGLRESRLAEYFGPRVVVVIMRHGEYGNVVGVAADSRRGSREAVFGRCERASGHDFHPFAVVGEDVSV